MSTFPLFESQIDQELVQVRDNMVTAGTLPSAIQLDAHLQRFAELFAPNRLAQADNMELLYLMHRRGDPSARSLVHWLEFKNDDEFYGNDWFGGIGGGSALKFGLYHRQQGDTWVSGSPTNMRPLSVTEAIRFARNQRDELLAGCRLLAELISAPPEDTLYARLQAGMEQVAPTLHADGWAHKYWSLIFPQMLDHYHSPRYQRYHLYKVLQVPPCDDGILVTPKAPRFVCAGRFVQLASKLQVPPAALALILNRRDGAFRRYWKIGTTEGSDGGSNWDEMRRGGFVSIGWKGTVPDLREHVIGMEEAAAKRLLRDMLHGSSTNAGVVTRKAGEIYNFATRIQDADLVLACEGQTVLGVGRVTGPYEYNDSLRFPHLRRVEWIELDTWRLPDNEGPRTTVYELGSYPGNLIELERRLASRRLGRMQNDGAPPHATQSREVPLEAPRPLDRITARIEAVLKRKSQVILYGPPGTGKTMHAVAAARELAARRNLGRAFSQLDAQSQQRCETKYVQTCTFHPGWSYEDFIEGLRPQVSGDAMVFTPRDGIFKNLCRDAAKDETSSYFLVIDEINRGDLPRIFGELMTTIETSKRGKEVTLPVTGKRFAVPANVFLIGTMNTADRSVSLMDTALRRRFGFIELMPDSKLFGKVDVGGLRLGPWLDALNQRLRARLKRDARNMQVGHAYLLPVPSSLSQFADIVRDDIIPLLEEYCYDDFHMLAEILGKNVVDVENACIREHLFDPEHERELVQALQFEEMQEAVLDQAPTLDLESDIDSDNDADESPAA